MKFFYVSFLSLNTVNFNTQFLYLLLILLLYILKVQLQVLSVHCNTMIYLMSYFQMCKSLIALSFHCVKTFFIWTWTELLVAKAFYVHGKQWSGGHSIHQAGCCWEDVIIHHDNQCASTIYGLESISYLAWIIVGTLLIGRELLSV